MTQDTNTLNTVTQDLKKNHNYQHKTTFTEDTKTLKNINNDTRHHKEQYNH